MTPDASRSRLRPSAFVGSARTLPRRSAKFVVRSVSGVIFRVLGASAPAGFDAASCLVIAPHPDDETLGCGATIARKRAAGTQVTVVIVSDGRRSPRAAELTEAEFVVLRRTEALEALSRLGVAADDVEFLDFEDGTLVERLPEVAAALRRVIQRRSPQQVLVTSTADRHPDHAAVARVARHLLETGDLTGELFEYPVWQRMPALSTTAAGVRSRIERAGRSSPHGRPASAVARLRPVLVRTDGHLETKRLALAAYPSQLPYLPVGFVEDFLQPFEVLVAISDR